MTDDDLRSMIRGTDPAADLPELPPGHIARLLEKTMTSEKPAPVPRRRLVLAAAAALLVIAAGVTWTVTRTDKSPVPGNVDTLPLISEASGASAEGRDSTVTLTLTGAQAKCIPPTAAKLAERADLAFAGTVTTIDAGAVTLHITHVYKGTPATTATIQQMDDSSEQLVGASGKFATGTSYLVAAAANAVMICGYSGDSTAPGLQDLYDQAF